MIKALNTLLTKDYDIIRPICIALPQISGYIKEMKDGRVLVKYREIWNRIKKNIIHEIS